MGHGISVPHERTPLVFVSTELQEGSKKLSRDLNLRLAFVCYIKSSEWLDQLAVLVPNNILKLSDPSPNFGELSKCFISSYNMTKEKISEVETLLSSTSLKSITRSISNQASPRSPKSDQASRKRLESYFNIEESLCFNGDQYLACLIHILHPIFLASPQYRRYLKRGIEHGRALRDEEGNSMSSYTVGTSGAATMVPCAQSKRLQDILLGCAAYFDETCLEKRLCKPEWIFDVANALNKHLLSICVIDIHSCREKVVYTNKAFNALTEFTPEDLCNVNLNVLNGPETEIAQLRLLQEAMKPMQTAKFAITYYTKSKRAFTDLVAVKTTAHYSVMVHFAAVKGANLADLKGVDDLLILVSQIFEPAPALQGSTPASPQAATWLPAPLASMMHHLPSPRFLPSPSFLRSRSSSTSGSARSKCSGGNGGGPGSGGGNGGGISVGSANATKAAVCDGANCGTPTSAATASGQHNAPLRMPRAAGARTDPGTATDTTTRTSFSGRGANYCVEESAEGTEELGAAAHI